MPLLGGRRLVRAALQPDLRRMQCEPDEGLHFFGRSRRHGVHLRGGFLGPELQRGMLVQSGGYPELPPRVRQLCVQAGLGRRPV